MRVQRPPVKRPDASIGRGASDVPLCSLLLSAGQEDAVAWTATGKLR